MLSGNGHGFRWHDRGGIWFRVDVQQAYDCSCLGREIIYWNLERLGANPVLNEFYRAVMGSRVLDAHDDTVGNR